MSARRWRAGLAVAVVAVSVLVPSGRARPAQAATPSRAGAGAGAGLIMLAQSAYVQGSGTFRIRLQTPTGTGDRLTVQAYPRLTTRSGFDRALAGQTTGSPIYRPTVPVSTQPVDPAGGIDVDIPVNSSSGTGTLPTFNARAGTSAVYPLQLRLGDANGVPVGSPLTTFLVYAYGPPSATSFPRLSVSLTLPVGAATSVDGAGSAARLPGGASAAVGREVGTLGAHLDVPVSLQVNPQTVDALAAGPAADRTTLAALGRVLGTGSDEVLPAPYVPLNLPAMAAAGLGPEVTTQLAAGAAVVSAHGGRRPVTGTWAAHGAVDPASLALLASQGVARLIVPAADLSPLPQNLSKNTFAAPALLVNRSTHVPVYAADPTLSDRFVAGGDQVLAAHQLLAELTMIQLEQPGQTRGVAVVAPAGWAASQPFLDAVLAGLRANPLLAPVTADGLFAAVPPASQSQRPLERTLAVTRNAAPLPGAAALRAARSQLDGFDALVPNRTGQSASLRSQLLVAEAADLGDGARKRVLAGVTAAVRTVEHRITLPGSSSITLTARQGSVPLTVLSDPALRARVELRLSSQKLVFRPFTPAGGTCAVRGGTTEVCQLQLTSEATTFKIPVETRTSGVFGLQVTLVSPGGAVVLGTNRDTVRSTVVSGVGVILIIVAALGLALWWGRNFRHGRRSRDLVDPDTAEIALPEVAEARGHPVPPVPDGGGAAAGEGQAEHAALDDRVIAEFFASPAPRYPDVSPSGRPRGPNS